MYEYLLSIKSLRASSCWWRDVRVHNLEVNRFWCKYANLHLTSIWIQNKTGQQQLDDNKNVVDDDDSLATGSAKAQHLTHLIQMAKDYHIDATHFRVHICFHLSITDLRRYHRAKETILSVDNRFSLNFITQYYFKCIYFLNDYSSQSFVSDFVRLVSVL